MAPMLLRPKQNISLHCSITQEEFLDGTANDGPRNCGGKRRKPKGSFPTTAKLENGGGTLLYGVKE